VKSDCFSDGSGSWGKQDRFGVMRWDEQRILGYILTEVRALREPPTNDG
jgi:hypothetical protein